MRASQPIAASNYVKPKLLATKPNAALTLRLAPSGKLFSMLALPVLALASLVIAALCVGTWRGLRNGSLLVPEN